MNPFLDHLAEIVLAFFGGWLAIEKILSIRKKKTITSQGLGYTANPQVSIRPAGAQLLTPPPTPINRMEFLQARIAYLAHMRDIGIEVTEKDESGNVKTHIRPAKAAEMIEAINLQDEDHIKALFDTWDQVQKKQREKSL